MACRFIHKGKEYPLETFNAVAPKVQSRVLGALERVGISTNNKQIVIPDKIAKTDLNKVYEQLNKAEALFPEKIAGEGSIFKITKNTLGKYIVDINLNPILPVYIRQWESNRGGNQQSLFQIKEKIENETLPINRLNKVLENFLTTNGIGLSVLESLKERFGVDVRGAYDVLNKMVLVANGQLNEDTLPEEVGHVIVETLGKNHPLVKMLLNNLKKTDYKSLLSKDYLELYKNDKDLLLREAAGQLIGKAIVKKYKEQHTSVIKDIINKIVKAFKKVFNKDKNILENEFKKIYDTSDEIAKQVLTHNFDTSFKDFSTVNPDNPVFYQVKTAPKKDVFNEEKRKTDKLIAHHVTRIKYLQGKLTKETDPDKRDGIKKRIEEYTELLEDYKLTGTKGSALDMAEHTLKVIKTAIDSIDDGNIKIETLTDNDIEFIKQSLDLFQLHASLGTRAGELSDRFKPIFDSYFEKLVNSNRTDRQDRTIDDIMEVEDDVNGYRVKIGALSDVSSVLGTTAASLIKSAQNRKTRNNKATEHKISEARKKLKEAQSKRGVSEDNMYDIFIQEGKNTTYFVGKFNSEYHKDKSDALKKRFSGDSTLEAEGKKWLSKYTPKGKELEDKDIPDKYKNNNYYIIQANPELKAFYDFYTNTMLEAFDKIPVKNQSGFIANIQEKNLRTLLQKGGLKEASKGWLEDFIGLEDSSMSDKTDDLLTDAMPIMFVKPIAGGTKSRDLANSLNIFSRFAENHSQMSEVLPKLRMIQTLVEKKDYIPSTGKRKTKGIDSNLAEMIEGTIEMQVKGKVKKDSGKVKIGDKQFYLSTIGDKFLGYNSLLRIGANLTNAISNVVVGDVSNFIEAVGGQFFNLKQANKATTIFMQDAFKKESKLHKITDLLGILQEMDDYDALTGTAQKMSVQKAKETMFVLQKKGEYYLQTRPMIASMLHDQIQDKNGVSHSLWDAFDEKGDWKTAQFGELTNEKLDRMSNRIQRINQIIHGRYSSRDAGIATQHVFVRAALQFKKWIPTALENRFAAYYFDNRLGEAMEGRYKTGGRLFKEAFLSQDPDKRAFSDMIGSLFKNVKDLTEKDLTPLERANIRKNFIEVILISFTIVMSVLLLGGDDDEDKITNPWAKMAAEQLNRISGDLLFFLNPKEYVSMGRNIIPAAKTGIDLINIIIELPNIFGGEDSEYRSGPRKGENKFWSKAGSSILLVKPITDVGRVFWNDQPYMEMKKP